MARRVSHSVRWDNLIVGILRLLVVSPGFRKSAAIVAVAWIIASALGVDVLNLIDHIIFGGLR